jgi:phosphatidylserine decarboxylase
MKIVKDGYPFIIFSILAGFVTRRFSRLLSNLFFIFAGFCAFFFRDPDREFIEDETKIISPADGTLVAVEECEEPDYIKGPAYKIAIFMSIFNVHINRAPISGAVDYINYRPGNFDAAFNPRASFDNEMNIMGLQNSNIKVLIKQIAGFVARRIVCDVTEGDMLTQTDRFGMIKFSSRVEIFIPKRDDIKINVSLADQVRGGQTVIAEFVKKNSE